MKRFTFAVLLASLFIMTAAAISQDKKAAQQTCTPMKEIIIKFKPDAKPEQIKTMTAEFGLQQIKEIPALRMRVYKNTSSKALKEVIELCGKLAFVEYAEPNRIYKTQVEPTRTPASTKDAQQ
ncbi:MAG: S8 family serine peptidase [bacterium]